jgi:23S rRNA (uridine2552-2'-O)-methyltransferase
MARSKSSHRWLREHFDDIYVKQAQAAGYRSRAVYKLKEINEKDKLIRPGMVIVDLGAAPGGWSQLTGELTGGNATIIALDILPMTGLPGVTFIQADFTSDEALTALEAALGGRPVDLVMSDMMPNISGQSVIDQPKSMYLAELALDFASQVLKPGGDFLIKVFQGEGFDQYVRSLRGQFRKIVTRKPKASRPRSREVYLLARHREL